MTRDRQITIILVSISLTTLLLLGIRGALGVTGSGMTVSSLQAVLIFSGALLLGAALQQLRARSRQ